MFSKLAVMSPSVWWRNRAILKTVAQITQKPDLKIWLDVGTREGKQALTDVRALNRDLIKKGWKAAEISATWKCRAASIPNWPGHSALRPC